MGSPTVDKSTYKARVRQIMSTKEAQKVAANIAKGFRKTCKWVADNGGVAHERLGGVCLGWVVSSVRTSDASLFGKTCTTRTHLYSCVSVRQPPSRPLKPA